MNEISNLYIDLLKKALIDYIDLNNDGNHDKIEGKGLWPTDNSKTMIGLVGLNNLEYCINIIIKDNIDGDFLEAGVWRGGASIFMKALSTIFNTNKKIFVADSFDGFPKESNHDNINFWQNVDDKIKVSLETVKDNFTKYNLLDDNVIFLKGFFKDTLYTDEIKKLSLLRLDGDLYSSTMDTLDSLYPKLEDGGFVIIDDYNALDCAKSAVHDYRIRNNITEKIIMVGWSCAYWRKGEGRKFRTFEKRMMKNDKR